jgi:16S rRNA (guanine966-N2)-methyltransferase
MGKHFQERVNLFFFSESMYILAGSKKGMTLKVPKEGTRPTTNKIKKSLFDSLQHLIQGADVLDLFAGSGALGLEALSRGAKSATFVEKDQKAVECIQKNIETLGFHSSSTLYSLPVDRAINLLSQYDLIFVDPPYDLDISSFVEKIISHLKENGLMIVEQSKRAKFLQHLPCIKKKEFGDTVNYFFQKGSSDAK